MLTRKSKKESLPGFVLKSACRSKVCDRTKSIITTFFSLGSGPRKRKNSPVFMHNSIYFICYSMLRVLNIVQTSEACCFFISTTKQKKAILASQTFSEKGLDSIKNILLRAYSTQESENILPYMTLDVIVTDRMKIATSCCNI